MPQSSIISVIGERFTNIIRAAAGKQNLAAVDLSDIYNGPEDEIIEKKGPQAYWEMFRDAEISSDIDAVETLMLPAVQVMPGDDSDEGKRNADFVRGILTAMPGSELDTFRTMLREALVTGPSISEPQWAIKEIPEFGSVMGLESINVIPTESFFDAMQGIEVDKYGNIIQFNQSATYGGGSATLDEVIYWAFRGTPNNRWGTSMLRPVYDCWKYKQKILRIYGMFMTSNASGIRTIKIPRPKNMQGDPKAVQRALLEAAHNVAKKFASLSTVTIYDDWDMDLGIPPGAAGTHFLLMLQEMDRQIRRGILGDSAFSAQDQGSMASRYVSQSNVQARMRAWGTGFMQSMTEQICTRILKMNGFTGPVPRLVAEPPASERDPWEAMKVYGDLKQKGVIKDDLVAESQEAIARAIFGPAGIEVTLESAPEPEPDNTSVQAAEGKIIHATTAPPNRNNKALKKNEKQYETALEAGARDLVGTWQRIAPQILDKLSASLWSKDKQGNPNGWKSQDLTKIRQIVENNVRYKQGDMRKSLDATLTDGAKLGKAHAEKMVPIQAASTFTPAAVSASLRNRTYFILASKYPGMESEIYMMLENAVRGNVPPQTIRAQLEAYLIEGGAFREGLAATIVDTSLSFAYNEARMAIFNEVTDASGRTPNAIIGYVFAAQIDDRTTDICISFDGKAFKADDPSLPQPPLHYNCRSQLIPVFAGEEPWTPQSEGKFMTATESAAEVAKAKANGQIQPGFGGN